MKRVIAMPRYQSHRVANAIIVTNKRITLR